MSDAGALLARYLRQREELGEHELILDSAVLERLSSNRVANPEPASRSALRTVSLEAEQSDVVAAETKTATPLAEVAAIAAICTACRLAETRTNVVFADGDPNADLMVVGEAPGADEDRSGRPFVGRAGRLLDALLLSIGFPRETVYICNVLKCRPPGNRNPLPEEVHACSGFLKSQVGLVAPRTILAVGTFSAQTLLGTTETIGRLRGSVHSFEGTPVVPTYHPAALLRNPSWIRPVWEDLQRLRAILDG